MGKDVFGLFNHREDWLEQSPKQYVLGWEYLKWWSRELQLIVGRKDFISQVVHSDLWCTILKEKGDTFWFVLILYFVTQTKNKYNFQVSTSLLCIYLKMWDQIEYVENFT